MATQDTCCTIVPYFKAHAGKLDAFRNLCERFVSKTSSEAKCLYYGFSFDGDQIHCREGYVDAEAALAHIDNVGALLQESAGTDFVKELGRMSGKTRRQSPSFPRLLTSK